MSDEDGLDLDDNFDQGEAPSILQKPCVKHSFGIRRRLEEKLEASRVEKQTQDYDFDFD